MDLDRRLILMALAAGLAGCAGGAPAGGARPRPTVVDDFPPNLPFADWTEVEPEYRLYPGDDIEVALPTASELTRQLKIAPDGRVSLPLLGHVMAADRSLSELEADISYGYAPHLLLSLIHI